MHTTRAPASRAYPDVCGYSRMRFRPSPLRLWSMGGLLLLAVQRSIQASDLLHFGHERAAMRSYCAQALLRRSMGTRATAARNYHGRIRLDWQIHHDALHSAPGRPTATLGQEPPCSFAATQAAGGPDQQARHEPAVPGRANCATRQTSGVLTPDEDAHHPCVTLSDVVQSVSCRSRPSRR